MVAQRREELWHQRLQPGKLGVHRVRQTGQGIAICRVGGGVLRRQLGPGRVTDEEALDFGVDFRA